MSFIGTVLARLANDLALSRRHLLVRRERTRPSQGI